MIIELPWGEVVFSLFFGLLLGARLQSSTGEGRVRIGYLFGILGAALLYGSYDFYFYRFGDIALRRTAYWPGLSGAFFFGVLGLILGRELVGRRSKVGGDT